MIRIDAHLLARGELQHVLVLLVVFRRRAAHITCIRGPQHHGLAMLHAITRSITQARSRRLTGQLGGKQFVGGQLAVAVVRHGALGHLRAVRGRVRRRRSHIILLAGVHSSEKYPEESENRWGGEEAGFRGVGREVDGAGARGKVFLYRLNFTEGNLAGGPAPPHRATATSWEPGRAFPHRI